MTVEQSLSPVNLFTWTWPDLSFHQKINAGVVIWEWRFEAVDDPTLGHLDCSPLRIENEITVFGQHEADDVKSAFKTFFCRLINIIQYLIN